ncbi:MAG: putative Ig domain-containing protein, partial [Myxococcales bacterium]
VLDPSGAISGAPTDEGTFDFAAEVIDAAAPPQSAIAQLQIVVTNPLRIVTTSLPEGIVGAAYAAQIEAAGGAAPYAFRLVEGSTLPAGLSLAEDGAIGGMPVIAGTVAFTVEALDSGDPASAARAELSIGVSPDGVAAPLEIVTTSLPSATVGRPYSARIEIAGGTRPYFVSLDSGTVLPEGLMLSDAGDITGTPLHAGIYSLALRADDSSVPGQIALRTFSLVVQPESGSPLALLTTALPDAELGIPYQVQLEAAGGTQPYRFGATETSRLPSGLYIDASGLLQGTPLAAGVFTFTAAGWDASTPHQMATTALTLTVRSGLPGGNLTIVSTAVRKAKVALPYSQSLMALGGSGVYEWRMVRGVMPPGLQLAPEGLLTGVPTARGTFPFALEVRDTVTAAVAQADLFLTVMATGHAGVRIMPGGLPDTTVGAPYSIGLHGVGGSGPYDFALSGASPGIALTVETATRHTALEGVAEVSGLFRTVITATDTVGATGMLFDLVSVRPAAESLLFSTTMLPDGKVGLSYALQLGASGGEPPYSFAEARGTRLPDGLALQPSGLIHGVPLQAGEEPVILRVTDGSGQSAEVQFWLLIQQ